MRDDLWSNSGSFSPTSLFINKKNDAVDSGAPKQTNKSMKFSVQDEDLEDIPTLNVTRLLMSNSEDALLLPPLKLKNVQNQYKERRNSNSARTFEEKQKQQERAVQYKYGFGDVSPLSPEDYSPPVTSPGLLSPRENDIWNGPVTNTNNDMRSQQIKSNFPIVQTRQRSGSRSVPTTPRRSYDSSMNYNNNTISTNDSPVLDSSANNIFNVNSIPYMKQQVANQEMVYQQQNQNQNINNNFGQQNNFGLQQMSHQPMGGPQNIGGYGLIFGYVPNQQFLEDPTQQVGGISSMEQASGSPYRQVEYPSRTLFIRNLPDVVDLDKLKKQFSSYGEIRSIYNDVESPGFLMIAFFDIRSSKSAMISLNGVRWGDRKLDVRYCLPRDDCKNAREEEMNQGTIVVFNLDPAFSIEQVREIFAKHGEVKAVRSTPHKKTHKFVEFFDTRDAENALLVLNKTKISNKTIKIEVSRLNSKKKKKRVFTLQK